MSWGRTPPTPRKRSLPCDRGRLVIIKTFCNTCLQSYEILVEPKEVHLIKDVVNQEKMALCPRMCGGNVLIDSTSDLTEMTKVLRAPMTLTGREFYSAVHGNGLPDEVPKHPDTVESILKANRVKGATVEQRFGRIYLSKLQLENGFDVHLSSGLCGAVIVKITKE